MDLVKTFFDEVPAEGNPNFKAYQIMLEMAKKIESLEDRIDNLEFARK